MHLSRAVGVASQTQLLEASKLKSILLVLGIDFLMASLPGNQENVYSAYKLLRAGAVCGAMG